MRIKLLDRAAKFLPKKLRQYYTRWTNADMETIRNLLWNPDAIIEFWMDGFNDKGLDKAFMHIVALYDRVLHKDPNWHYFYEGHYSLIRCSFKYQDRVEQYLGRNKIDYRIPIRNWTEGTYVTVKYIDIYKEIFHNISVLIIKMYKDKNGDFLFQAADRVIHPFLNHGFYLAKMAGLLDVYKSDLDAEYYEADYMGKLAVGRAYHIGRIYGQRETHNYYSDYFARIKEKEDDI